MLATYSDVSVVWLVGPWGLAVGFLLLWISKAMGYRRVSKLLATYQDDPRQWTREQLGKMVSNMKT